jgi:hypothetical protein
VIKFRELQHDFSNDLDRRPSVMEAQHLDGLLHKR